MLPSFQEISQALTLELEQLELLRKKTIAQRTKYIGILILVLLTDIVLWKYAPSLLWIGILLLIVLAITYFVRYRRHKKAYGIEFKKSVVAPFSQKMLELCSLPNETAKHEYYCDYSPEERIGDDLIRRSLLFDVNITSFRGEDLFAGRLGLTDFQFSEIKLMENSDGNEFERFRGIFFVADFHKDFNGITLLETENKLSKSLIFRAMKRIDRMQGNESKKANKKIQLESEAFNKNFTVRTSDEITARYLLPVEMMERLIEFRKRHKHFFNISFVDSYMSIAIWTRKNYFETKINQRVTIHHLEAVYNDLSSFLDLIEQFNLNTRIWGK